MPFRGIRRPLTPPRREPLIINNYMHILNKENSIANLYLAELRDKSIQNDRMRFRNNIERIGMLMAYEISKKFHYQEKHIITPLADTTVFLPTGDLVVATILRAGMPFMNGFLNVFENAEAAFIGAMRGKHKADHSFDIDLDYVACPSLTGKTLIICDPMLASGKSLVEGCNSLMEHGMPTHVHLACVIASPEGIAHVQKHLPDATLWLAAVDDSLNEDFYIIPGLGDAGDLSFGEKL